MIEIAKKYASDKVKTPQARKNEEILGTGDVRLIDSDGEMIGVVSDREALERAYDEDYDLVEISPNAEPPVCRIMEYSKWVYEQQKKQKKQNKGNNANDVKEIKFGIKIAENDLRVKAKKIDKLLEKRGSKIRLICQLRGREISYPELGIDVLEKALDMLENEYVITGKPDIQGRNISMTIASA